MREYVSALSNAAAFHYKPQAYFVWGVNNETHDIVGMTFNQYCDHNKEPYQNFWLEICHAVTKMQQSILKAFGIDSAYIKKAAGAKEKQGFS